MSTSVPVQTPTIPHPDIGSTTQETLASLFQSTLAIKQNIELAQGTRGTAFASGLHGPTTLETQLAAVLRKVT